MNLPKAGRSLSFALGMNSNYEFRALSNPSVELTAFHYLTVPVSMSVTLNRCLLQLPLSHHGSRYLLTYSKTPL